MLRLFTLHTLPSPPCATTTSNPPFPSHHGDPFLQERMRGRTLQHLHSLFSKRLPEVQEADKALGDMLKSFQSVAGGPIDKVIPSFLEKSTRLRDMCDRLSAAMPSGAGGSAHAMLEGVAEDSNSRSSSSSSSNQAAAAKPRAPEVVESSSDAVRKTLEMRLAASSSLVTPAPKR